MRRLPAVVVLTGAIVWLLTIVDWESPVRAVMASAFLLSGPGLVLGGLLGITDVPLRLSVAFAGSVAIGTLISVALVYAEIFNTSLTLGLIEAVTVGLAIADARMGGAEVDVKGAVEAPAGDPPGR